jgi:hypothetical protein
MNVTLKAPFSLEALLQPYRNRRPAIVLLYENMYREAHHLIAVQQLQRAFPAAELPDLAGCLPGAETITLGLCTIGLALESRVAELFDPDPASAVILDELGTLWVNGLARQMHLDIRTEGRARGKQVSPAYRPGIGRWPVELQGYIFNHLPAAEAGVSLLDEMLMVPQKSVSMIVAVGTKLGRNCYAPGGK